MESFLDFLLKVGVLVLIFSVSYTCVGKKSNKTVETVKSFVAPTKKDYKNKYNNPPDDKKIRFHRRNYLANGKYYKVETRLFGNNHEGGLRYVFTFEHLKGSNDNVVREVIRILDDELGLKDKYYKTRFKGNTRKCWVEVKSRFITLK